MGLLNAGLAMLTVGYILGVWTACAIFSGRQQRDDSELSLVCAPQIPEVVWISERRS